MNKVIIIGGGLAGSEAAWQAANRGCQVELVDMKPEKYSPAHSSPLLGELVCSNSLRSNDPTSAVGLMKREMRFFNSLIMDVADSTAVPAGKALAVDRDKFAEAITARLESHPNISISHREVTAVPEPADHPTIIATGPLTAEDFAESLAELTGRDRLAFYDAIAPILDSESLNMDIVYCKSRYDDGPGDYLNCPMNREEYERFISELASADYMPLKDFEDAKYFEGCLPVEVICSRGVDTLRFGPMKPVGLPDPRTGQDPYAVVQLRMENAEGSTYNMVGFQTKMTYPEQKRIFRMIPGMENVEFVRLGSIHRNTFICAPELLADTLQIKKRPDLLLAGQLSGVEGYIESAAMGLLAGINAARRAMGEELVSPPAEMALGAMVGHLTKSAAKNFQPSNVNFGLFPAWEKKVPKRFRGEKRAEASALALEVWNEKWQISEQV
nr:methylenetetrahydrofolate--tRNA-(uracil(54)-C(5))-methyltransferase (FADH(2)-oxidizing) TrmFO [Desulfotalea psychrophila]